MIGIRHSRRRYAGLMIVKTLVFLSPSLGPAFPIQQEYARVAIDESMLLKKFPLRKDSVVATAIASAHRFNPAFWRGLEAEAAPRSHQDPPRRPASQTRDSSRIAIKRLILNH
jgi:hypothetical protein